MKKILIILVVLAGVTFLNAQTTFGVRLGLSPTVDPGTSHLIVNRGDPVREALFDAQKVRHSGQIGVTVRHDLARFWFASEVMYGQNITEYSLDLTSQYGEFPQGPVMYEVRTGYLDVPVMAGVKLGMVEVFSGFFLNATVHHNDALSEVNGYRAERGVTPGFLSGVGVNFGKFLIDLRYQQQFSNYGKGLYINDQELILKNAPGRLMATAGVRF